MINSHELELPLSRTYFHGSIGVEPLELYCNLCKLVFAFEVRIRKPVSAVFMQSCIFCYLYVHVILKPVL